MIRLPAPDTDPYQSGIARWWHLSRPSPELLAAAADGWIGSPPGTALDVGCGLGTEAGFLAAAGWQVAGIDLSGPALRNAMAGHQQARFFQADARRAPFASASFDLVLDRGCFHYLDGADRHAYAAQAWRVLRPGGRMLLRACLRSAGVRNDVDETVIEGVFADWTVDLIRQSDLPSDTRTMPALEIRLRRG